ncbi:MAG: hypothetical protein IPJ33_19560 [Gammaproteobacteria bacterium]|nr:hypothetical protein [Gammaproteobacteria bacterium]
MVKTPNPDCSHRLASGIREAAYAPHAVARSRSEKPPDDDTPGIFSVATNAINIMQGSTLAQPSPAGEPADVMITPRLAHIGLLDFDTAAEAINEGG